MLTRVRDFLKFDSLNPFFGVVESPVYPFSRFLRSNLNTKLNDMWNVLVGVHYPFSFEDMANKNVRVQRVTHPGLLDILLFPLLARAVFSHVRRFIDEKGEFQNINPEERKKPSYVLGAMFSGIFTLPRYLIGGALAIPAAAITILLHGFSQIFAWPLKKQAYQVETTLYSDEYVRESKCEKGTLGSILKKLGADLDDVKFDSTITDHYAFVQKGTQRHYIKMSKDLSNYSNTVLMSNLNLFGKVADNKLYDRIKNRNERRRDLTWYGVR